MCKASRFYLIFSISANGIAGFGGLSFSFLLTQLVTTQVNPQLFIGTYYPPTSFLNGPDAKCPGNGRMSISHAASFGQHCSLPHFAKSPNCASRSHVFPFVLSCSSSSTLVLCLLLFPRSLARSFDRSPGRSRQPFLFLPSTTTRASNELQQSMAVVTSVAASLSLNSKVTHFTHSNGSVACGISSGYSRKRRDWMCGEDGDDNGICGSLA